MTEGLLPTSPGSELDHPGQPLPKPPSLPPRVLLAMRLLDQCGQQTRPPEGAEAWTPPPRVCQLRDACCEVLLAYIQDRSEQQE